MGKYDYALLSIKNEINMDNLLNNKVLQISLRTLGTLLEELASAQINIIVCGGSSLIATGLVNRTTKDVDIVAMLDAKGNIVEAQPLPAVLIETADQVATSLNLPKSWLNNGPRSIVNPRLPNYGLPEVFFKESRNRSMVQS